MFTEARKIHLLQEVLKTSNKTTLIELETILGKVRKKQWQKEGKLSIYGFVGILIKKEANQMRNVIEETCEKVK